MKILWIPNVSTKITHFPWHCRPLTMFRNGLYKHKTAQVKPVLSSYLAAQGRQEAVGKELGLCQRQQSQIRDGAWLCLTTPTWSLRQDSQALRFPGPPPGTQSPGLPCTFLRVWGRRTKSAGPSPGKKGREREASPRREMGLRPLTLQEPQEPARRCRGSGGRFTSWFY